MPTLSRQTSALLSHVVEQIADGVLITDRQGFIEYVNPAFELMTGFSSDDVRGKTPRILKSGLQDSAFYERLWAELMAGSSFQATMGNRRKTGEIYYLLTYSLQKTLTKKYFGLIGEKKPTLKDNQKPLFLFSEKRR